MQFLGTVEIRQLSDLKVAVSRYLPPSSALPLANLLLSRSGVFIGYGKVQSRTVRFICNADKQREKRDRPFGRSRVLLRVQNVHFQLEENKMFLFSTW